VHHLTLRILKCTVTVKRILGQKGCNEGMGWIESEFKSNKELIQAIKDLRLHFGESQSTFAARLGLSKRAITNYEIDRRPTTMVLARLAKLASDEGLGRVTNLFMLELGYDLRLAEIKGGVMSWEPSKERGYMLLQFEGTEAAAYGRSVFQAFSRYNSGDKEARGKAAQLLKQFSRDVAAGK
jgi:transcriptional regulator with XRE-family HTH domain